MCALQLRGRVPHQPVFARFQYVSPNFPGTNLVPNPYRCNPYFSLNFTCHHLVPSQVSSNFQDRKCNPVVRFQDVSHKFPGTNLMPNHFALHSISHVNISCPTKFHQTSELPVRKCPHKTRNYHRTHHQAKPKKNPWTQSPQSALLFLTTSTTTRSTWLCAPLALSLSVYRHAPLHAHTQDRRRASARPPTRRLSPGGGGSRLAPLSSAASTGRRLHYRAAGGGGRALLQEAR